jgi:undecaprenyl diphosphate synthase
MKPSSLASAQSKPPLRHIAIIMDGNGRWANTQGLPRLKGHQQGAQRVIELAQYCKKQNIPYLSLFAFSTENWQRPKQEVTGLFRLLNQFVKKYLKTLHQDQVRLIISGQLDGLPKDTQVLLKQAIEATASYTRYTLNICVNYGGQDEIVRASLKVAQAIQQGRLKPADLNPQTFQQFLDTASMPPVDLLIRTSGEMRLSNFLLYQLAYAELLFVTKHWPAFKTEDLAQAIKVYQKRTRRFGTV